MPVSARRRISLPRASSTRRGSTAFRCLTRARRPRWRLIGGEINFALTNLAAAIPHLGGGRLRALGVTSTEEAPQLPGVPPIAKTLPGFENVGWFGIVAPAGTPKEIVQKIYEDTRKTLESSEMRARFYAQGLAPVGNSPAQFAAAMKAESQLWARVVRERKIEVK